MAGIENGIAARRERDRVCPFVWDPIGGLSHCARGACDLGISADLQCGNHPAALEPVDITKKLGENSRGSCMVIDSIFL